MSNKSSKKRIFYFDELRAIAIFAVILCHVANLFPYIRDNMIVAIPFFCSDLGRIGVPIFLMLSGALLLNREYELVSFFKRRFSRVLIPFIFWVIVISLIRFTLLDKSPKAVVDWALGSGLTWYIWELLGIYLFTPVVNEFIRRYEMKGVKYFLVLWIAYLVLKNFDLLFIPHFKLGYFCEYIGYLFLGYYLVNTNLKVNDLVMILLGAVLFIVSYIINCNISFYITGKTIPYLYFTMILQGVGIFIAFKHISMRAEKKPNKLLSKIHRRIENGRIGKVLVSISICSYGMYFVHYIICKLWPFVFNLNTLKWIPPLWVLTVILSWIIILILSKIPYVNKISGV